MREALVIIGIIAILAFGGIFMKVVFFPANTVDKSVDMAYEVTNETLDGKNAIATYEWFKDREGEIASLYKKEENAQEQLDAFLEMFPDKENWTREDKNEYSRLSTNVTAVKNMLDNAIEDYNAEASKSNKAIFKDNLPSNITRAFYAGQDLTN